MPIDTNEPIENVFAAYGSAAAPGAGVSFCSFGSAPDAGIYRLTGVVMISGAQETTAMNIALAINNSTFVKFPSTGAIGTPIQFDIPRVTLDGTTHQFLATVGAGAASTVYSGTLIATRIG